MFKTFLGLTAVVGLASAANAMTIVSVDKRPG